MDDLIPNSDLLNVTFSVWDMGQDIAASAEVLGNQTWECSLAFTINVPVAIVGETSTVVPAGASNGTFEVKFEGSGLNLQFTTTCTSPESGRLNIFLVKNQYKLILNNLKRELNKQDSGWHEQLVHRLPRLLRGHRSSSPDKHRPHVLRSLQRHPGSRRCL